MRKSLAADDDADEEGRTVIEGAKDEEYWLRLKKRLLVEAASRRREDTSKYANGPARNHAWFGVLEEWRYMKAIQKQEMEMDDDGLSCTDPKSSHALLRTGC